MIRLRPAAHSRKTAAEDGEPVKTVSEGLGQAIATVTVTVHGSASRSRVRHFPGIEISRGTAYAGIADVKVRNFDH
jgi:hypothetical protein